MNGASLVIVNVTLGFLAISRNDVSFTAISCPLSSPLHSIGIETPLTFATGISKSSDLCSVSSGSVYAIVIDWSVGSSGGTGSSLVSSLVSSFSPSEFSCASDGASWSACVREGAFRCGGWVQVSLRVLSIGYVSHYVFPNVHRSRRNAVVRHRPLGTKR